MTLNDVYLAGLRYLRSAGVQPSQFQVSPASRRDLWREIRDRVNVISGAPIPDEDTEPPLYMPLYVGGVPLFAAANVGDDEVWVAEE